MFKPFVRSYGQITEVSFDYCLPRTKK